MQGQRCRPAAARPPPTRSPSSRGAARCLCRPYRNEGGSAALGLGRAGTALLRLRDVGDGMAHPAWRGGESDTPSVHRPFRLFCGARTRWGAGRGELPPKSGGAPVAGAGSVPAQCSNVPLFSWGHKGLQCGRAGPGRGRGAAGGGHSPSVHDGCVGGRAPTCMGTPAVPGPGGHSLGTSGCTAWCWHRPRCCQPF